MLALALMFAPPQRLALSDELSDLNEQLLDNPQSTALNLRYARAAEAAGKPRLALAAYERILLNDPENHEAQMRYARLRRQIQPPSTTFRVSAGARWDSSPYNVSGETDSDYETFFQGSMIDERPIEGRRWRSSVAVEEEVWSKSHDLDFGYVGVQTGPMFELGPRLTLLPAIGASIASLDDDYYYNEFAATVGIEGRVDGLSPWARLRIGARDYRADFTATDGYYVEAMGGVTVPHISSDKDRLSISGWIRGSDIGGSAVSNLNEEIAPGQYDEYGAEVSYSYEASSYLTLGVGVLGRERFYQESQAGDENRHDVYLAPEVSATINRVLPCNCSIRVSYRHRDNSSNDSFYDYGADQGTLAIIARF